MCLLFQFLVQYLNTGKCTNDYAGSQKKNNNSLRSELSTYYSVVVTDYFYKQNQSDGAILTTTIPRLTPEQGYAMRCIGTRRRGKPFCSTRPHWAGWLSGNALDLNSEGDGFQSRSGPRLYRLRYFITFSSHSSAWSPGKCKDRISTASRQLPSKPLPFHDWFYHSVLHSLPQGWANYGPRAVSGPWELFIRPAELLWTFSYIVVPCIAVAMQWLLDGRIYQGRFWATTR
jgi:hypothetical protein